LILKPLFRRAFAAIALLVSAAAAPASTPSAAHPALWAVSDPDTTIYLFGTIHLLPEHYEWRTPTFDDAVSHSQQLMIETIVDLKHPQSFYSDLMRLGFARGLPPIAARVPRSKLAALRASIAASHIPEKQFDQMKTWAAAFQLLGVRFAELGLKGQEGPETTLREEFATAQKPVGELETNAEQLGFFDRLPEKAQRDLLLGAIDQPAGMTKEFNQMLATWARGDVPGIAATFNRDLAASPDLADALIRQRNANWSRWIEQRMAEPGTIMVAVGAGHLAGRDSVIALLKRDGYRVRRLQ
jgi:uncharacterized protein